MNKKNQAFFFLAMITIFLPHLDGQVKKSEKDLPVRYRKWLTEEVVYIISPREKEVFLRLESDRDRDIFTESFWKQRDPTPNSPANEYKEEHYRRINYANQHFGRESPERGWRSEMGRVYILLGEPNSTENYENMSEILPTVIWFYEGVAKFGLPNAINIVFFKQDTGGEFKLYTPIKIGPQGLLPFWKGDVKDYGAAYEKLLVVSPSLADVSISLLPGEAASLNTISIASDVMIFSKLPAAGYAGVKDAYAERLLTYKDLIDVEYSSNYIDSDTFLDIIQDSSGIFFVHYLIEPKKLSFEETNGKYQAWLEINGTVSDLKGLPIHQIENKVPIEFTEEQFNQIRDKLFSYQDMFPLVPGAYKFNCLIKNSVGKGFTSMQANITIPEAPLLQISSLILANRINRDPKSKGKNQPFVVGGVQFVPSPRNDFVRSDSLHLFFQIYGLTEDLRQNGRLTYVLSNETGLKPVREKALKDYPDALNLTEEFSLADVSPGYYSLKVTLTDQANKEILSKEAPFMVTPLTGLPRPWVLSLSQPAPADPSYIHMRGNQYFHKKDLPRAKPLLEDAYRRSPRNIRYALDFGRALFADKAYEQVIQIARPFLQGENKYDVLEILGQSSQALDQFAEAILYYKDYLARFGTNLTILNSIGDCYYRLGDLKEALIAWEKSIEINPKQEDLIKRVQLIKEKK